ncbi:hypothetical protein [Curtobacterium sp. MCBD17_040]|uniref:hypothetical protein n=1 Tax=Curtobacterium sp. MCBD17_040 TaxID=2175674 RepID=UPI0011B688F4|nr:hypothetical protein [Curtobacterium sp. MCBD17_040]WIB65872.1 hypothetical protein DEI94_17305 [Curtobacterium sp. MCBD17_040]
MEQTAPSQPRHRAGELGAPPTVAPARTPWQGVAIWGGRALLALTVAAAVLTAATRDQWTMRGFDDIGSPTSPIPNVALGMTLAVGVIWHWVFGLSAIPETCWREGGTLVAPTVWGRRHIQLRGALVIPFRLFSQSGTLHGAFLVDRRARPIMLLEPFQSSGPTRVQRLTGQVRPATFRQAAVEYLAGAMWGFMTVIAVGILLGVLDVCTGAMGHP